MVPPTGMPADFFQMYLGLWGSIGLALIIALGILTATFVQRKKLGWELVTYIYCTVLPGAIGFIAWRLTRNVDFYMGIFYVTSILLMAFSAMGVFLGIMEFGLMRLLGLFRLGAISRITYYEAILQPFTIIVLGAGIACIGVCARLGFFTYNEDFKMYRDMAASFVCLFSLPVMVFASTKVIDEEIENRTMLTLMSKPVSRTQVVLGKYLGVLMIVLVCVGILGIMAGTCSYLRYFDDMSIDFRLAAPQEHARLIFDNYKATLAFLPGAVLTFLQVATLAAISVAVSTRYGLAVNIATVVLIYIAANLGRYVANAPELPGVVRVAVSGLTYLLPGLGVLDLNQRLVFGDYILGDSDWKLGLPTYGTIWKYVGLATVYAAFYISGVLSFGIALFRTRELS